MKKAELAETLDRLFPVGEQNDWDNSGLNISADGDVHGVLITLDVTLRALEEAVKVGADFVIAHHPLLFVPLKNLGDDYTSVILRFAVKNDIAVYCAHTSADNMQGGLNDEICGILGLETVRVLCDEGGRVGEIPPVTLGEFFRTVRRKLDDPFARYCGSPEKIIRKVAVVNGAGGRSEEFLAAAMRSADVFLSSEFKYSSVRFATEENFAIIETGHYNSENAFCGFVKRSVEKLGLETVVFDSGEPYRNQ